jgi:hypothetical protein
MPHQPLIIAKKEDLVEVAVICHAVEDGTNDMFTLDSDDGYDYTGVM